MNLLDGLQYHSNSRVQHVKRSNVFAQGFHSRVGCRRHRYSGRWICRGLVADDKPPRRPNGKAPPPPPKTTKPVDTKDTKDTKDAKDDTKDDMAEDDITPTEDLMRQHGVHLRLLLVWSEAVRRIERKLELPVDSLLASAKLMRSFVEDYHQHLEEEFIFSRFRKAEKLVNTVTLLKTQHDAGRKATDVVIELATAEGIKDAASQAKLVNAMLHSIRMFFPHMAREDTVLFPLFRDFITQDEYDALDDTFGKEEDKHLGEDGFPKVVDQISEIEKKFGIVDLAQYTPKS